MSFDDLPDDWHLQPLTEPGLVTDVLDLLIRDADRRAGGLAVIVCDGAGLLVQPCFVTHDADRRVDDVEPATLIRPFVSVAEQDPDGGALLIAVVRPDGLSVTDADQRLHRAALAVCRARTMLLGVHLVTRHGSRQLPPPPARHSVA